MVPTVFWVGLLLSCSVLIASPIISTIKGLDVPLHPGEKDRCPVCGMFVAPYPEWIGQVRHGDGTTVFFDGCKDLFKYLLSVDRSAPGKGRKTVAAVFVTNYYDGEIIAARTAFFVFGSDVMGPMGPELVPHRTLDAAEDFMEDHNGLGIVGFDEVTEAVLRELQ